MANRSIRRLFLAAACIAALFVVWCIFNRDESENTAPDPNPIVTDLDPPPPDPRLAFNSPFRNVKPEVKYVGDAACAGCHAEIDKSYHAHPMGRSAALVSQATPIERFDAAAHNPTRTGPFELYVERRGEAVVHRIRAKGPKDQSLPDYETTADLAIGSGAHGRSYVCLQSGAAWQTPISWFTAETRWDRSPGFDLGNGGRRPIVAGCLFCHVNRAEPIPGALNRFREPLLGIQAAIGCERCHGPGELHVKERTSGPLLDRIDTSIVNPKHLSTELRMGICAQCHLQGEERIVRRGRELNDFRPGLPLQQFLTIFVRHPEFNDLQRSVSQFEQLQESRCFVASRGTLDCVSCHDPHTQPTYEQRERFFNGKCAKCHSPGSTECSERLVVRRAKDHNCLTCHMPRSASSNIVHASIIDHRILRSPNSEGPGKLMPVNSAPLVLFRIGPHSELDADRERDLGIALSRALVEIPQRDARAIQYVSSLAEKRLSFAVSRWRGDGPAWLALSIAKQKKGDLMGGLEAAETAVEMSSEGDVARSNLISALASAGRYDQAIEVATLLVKNNPTAIEPLLQRAEIHLQQRDWKKAEADCQAALNIHPLNARSRLLLAICKHRLGDLAGGIKEAEIGAALTTSPQQRALLLDTFRAETR